MDIESPQCKIYNQAVYLIIFCFIVFLQNGDNIVSAFFFVGIAFNVLGL